MGRSVGRTNCVRYGSRTGSARPVRSAYRDWASGQAHRPAQDSPISKSGCSCGAYLVCGCAGIWTPLLRTATLPPPPPASPPPLSSRPLATCLRPLPSTRRRHPPRPRPPPPPPLFLYPPLPLPPIPIHLERLLLAELHRRQALAQSSSGGGHELGLSPPPPSFLHPSERKREEAARAHVSPFHLSYSFPSPVLSLFPYIHPILLLRGRGRQRPTVFRREHGGSSNLPERWLRRQSRHPISSHRPPFRIVHATAHVFYSWTVCMLSLYIGVFGFGL